MRPKNGVKKRFGILKKIPHTKDVTKNIILQLGHPVLVYVRFPSDLDHEYFYARWTGTKWVDREIVNSGKWFADTPPGKTEPGNLINIPKCKRPND